MNIPKPHNEPHRMLIVMDKEKLYLEKKYSYRKILSFLDERFFEKGLTKNSDGWYVGGTFEIVGGMYAGLSDLSWFVDNIKQWLWYDGDTGEMIDLVKHIQKQRAKGIWPGA